MHAIKGGWVGQTFALAKCKDNGGKKSRIRRSKEERKAMVESFIRKYQKSNSGNFPSLNLTHKEVGGSFYIIREIVREIIQENRVLGPAKFTEGEQNIDQFLEQNPLGSISTTPKTSLPVESNGSPFVPSHHEDANDGSLLVSDGHAITSEDKKVDSKQIINGNFVDVTNVPCHHEDANDGALLVSDGHSIGFEDKKFDSKQVINGNFVDVTDGTDKVATAAFQEKKVATVDVQVTEPLEGDDSGKELVAATSKVTQITADVVVETFPIPPVAKPTDSLVARSSELTGLNENLAQTENVKVNVSLENGCSKFDDINPSEVSILKDEKEVENSVDLLLEKNSDLADKKVMENISDPLVESSDCSTRSAMHDNSNGAALEVSGSDVLTSEKNEQSKAIVEEAINASNRIHPKVHGTYTGSSIGESPAQEAVVVDGKDDVQHVNLQKRSNKPLDRINLESWEGTSKSAAHSETNPLWAIFKSFVVAFMKFWSD